MPRDFLFNLIKEKFLDIDLNIVIAGSSGGDKDQGPEQYLTKLRGRAKFIEFDPIADLSIEKPSNYTFPFGLSNTNEIIKFYINEEESTSSIYLDNESISKSLYLSGKRLDNFLKCKKIKEVKFVTLDRMAESHSIQSDFIYLNIQGSEFKALQGAKRLLNDNSILGVQFESQFIQYYSTSSKWLEIDNLLKNNRLRFSRFLFPNYLTYYDPVLSTVSPMELDDGLIFETHFLYFLDPILFKSVILSDEKLIKLSLFAALYGENSFSLNCLRNVLKQTNSEAIKRNVNQVLELFEIEILKFVNGKR